MNYNIKINFTPSIIMTIIFVILKVNDFINWSWLWIFSPLWIFSIIVIFVLGIIHIKYKKYKR